MVYRTSQNGVLRLNTEKWHLFLNILKIVYFNYNLEKYFGNFRCIKEFIDQSHMAGAKSSKILQEKYALSSVK